MSHRAKAEMLWLRYFISTEEYDRTLPHIMRGDTSMPLPGWPMSSSRSFARKEMNRLDAEAKEIGVDAEEMRAAKDWASCVPLERAKEYLRIAQARADEAKR